MRLSCHLFNAYLFSHVPLQALAQELNFSAYLGLPVFMIPLKGLSNANLARVLLNHIHTGHHTSNVRRSTSGINKHTKTVLRCQKSQDSGSAHLIAAVLFVD